MALPTATIGRKTGTIIVCFLLLSFVLGLLMSLFKDSVNNLSSLQSSLLTAAENFLMLLISMVVIKKQVLFEADDWKKVANRLTIINLIVVVIATILATTSMDWLYRTAYPIPHTNELTSIVKSAALGLIETTIIIYISAWLVLRKPNNQV